MQYLCLTPALPLVAELVNVRFRHSYKPSRRQQPVYPAVLSAPTDTLPLMSNAAPWAATAGNKFREVARSTENPTTKLLAEGLTALTEAMSELDAKLERIEQQMRSNAP
jgi:hypothetical protein